MKCLGCYKKIEKNEYCLSCRKKLFDGKRVSTVLEFDKPTAENTSMYNEYSKRMSISGVQLKYSLKLVVNKLELCEKNGQYIIKPIPTGYFTQSLPAFQRKVYHPKGGVEACSNLVNFFGS